MSLSDETIQETLDSDSMHEVVDSESNRDKIKLEFEKAFDQAKSLLGDKWQDVRTIYDMSFDKDFDLKKETRYVTLGALAYLVSPIDLLPEKLLGPLGLADDAAVLFWAINRSKPEIERYRAFKGEALAENDEANKS